MGSEIAFEDPALISSTVKNLLLHFLSHVRRLLELNRLESERVSSVQRELDTSVAQSEEHHSELCQQIKNLKTQVHEKSLSLQRKCEHYHSMLFM